MEGVRFLLVGTKATAELGLGFLVYNLKRAINMVGVEKLIEAM